MTTIYNKNAGRASLLFITGSNPDPLADLVALPDFLKRVAVDDRVLDTHPGGTGCLRATNRQRAGGLSGTTGCSSAPNPRNVACCAAVKLRMPVMLRRS